MTRNETLDSAVRQGAEGNEQGFPRGDDRVSQAISDWIIPLLATDFLKRRASSAIRQQPFEMRTAKRKRIQVIQGAPTAAPLGSTSPKETS